MQIPARAPHAFGRPPSPTLSLGIELTRLLLATIAATGRLPWHASAGMRWQSAPRNAATEQPTSGINTLLHLTMRAARPELAGITATAKQWTALDAAILPACQAHPLPAVYYRRLSPETARAVPMRSAVWDVTQVEFATTNTAHAFAARFPRTTRIIEPADLVPATAHLETAVRAAHRAPHADAISRLFGSDTTHAAPLIADLAAAFAALAREAPYAPQDLAPLIGGIELLARRPDRILAVAASAQRIASDMPGSATRPRHATAPNRRHDRSP